MKKIRLNVKTKSKIYPIIIGKNIIAQTSNILKSNIPSHLRDTKNRWFSLSKRARIVIASKERVDVNSIKTIGNPTNNVGFFRFACEARKPQILER